MKHISLGTACSCTEISDRTILVTGSRFIKVFSLDTYEEIKDIPSDNVNYNSLVIPDRNVIFIATYNGLYEYSLTDFELVKVHEPSSDINCLLYLRSKDTVLFNDGSNLISLNLNDSTVTMFEDGHTSYINCLVSTSDEKYFFTTGGDNKLKQWDTDTLSIVKSVNIKSEGISLLIREKTRTILVGTYNGYLLEYSLNELYLIRTVEVHNKLIRRILKLSSGDIVVCSSDGSICLPLRDNVPIDVSENQIISMTELSDKTIACCCGDGLIVIPFPAKTPQLVENPQTISTTVDPITPTLDSLSSSISSIRRSTSDKKTQLISLLQHHLAQLVTAVRNQPEKFSGLTLSLLPDLKSIQRSYCYEGVPEARKRVLTQKYSLEMMSSNSSVTDAQAILNLFDRKLKLLGKISDANNPMSSFKIEKVRRSKWVFSMDDPSDVNPGHIYGPATVHFLNGYLNCYILEGDLINKSGFQSTLKVNEIVKRVSALGNDGVVVTSDRRMYTLNFETNTIDEY